jgi:hypothetical protein
VESGFRRAYRAATPYELQLGHDLVASAQNMRDTIEKLRTNMRVVRGMRPGAYRQANRAAAHIRRALLHFRQALDVLEAPATDGQPTNITQEPLT